MKIKRLFLSTALIGLLFASMAAPIDSSTARTIANNFMTYQRQMPAANLQRIAIPASISNPANRTNGDAFFIFSGNNSFVIVSADDAALPILGYSDAGAFVASDMPIAMVELLQNYEAQINYMRSNSVQQTADIRQQWQDLASGNDMGNRNTMSVNPLLIDNWGQGDPCNLFCPYDVTDSARTVVGCAALSMAQVLHYWHYPTNGIGSHSYIDTTYGLQTADFANTTYLYHLMPNDVYSSVTQAQKEAVSTLTYHCGVSMEMNYGVNGSSAFPIGAAPSAEYSLRTYFGFPNAHSICKYQFNSDQQWMDSLIYQLDLNRPVLYSGFGNDGGHSFVVDGYNNNNYLHINWGWYGQNNGYYALGNLNPGTSTFNSNNLAIIDIVPPQTPISDSCIISLYSSVGGHFNPEGPEIKVARGSSLDVQITADDDYYICSVVVDSVDVGVVDLVEFDSIVNHHYVYVFFQSQELETSDYELGECKVFPNPTQGEVYVELPSEWGYCNLTVYDVRGSVVGRKVVNNGSLVNLSHLSHGLYFFEMENNGLKRVSKVIKN